MKNIKAFTHKPGWTPPDGQRLLKSKYTRSAKGIALFAEACRMLAREFNAKYANYSER